MLARTGPTSSCLSSGSRNASAVSQSLRALVDTEVLLPTTCRNAWSMMDQKEKGQFKLYIANTPELRRRTRCLAHDVYVRAGYAKRGKGGIATTKDDELRPLFEVLICSASGRAAATVSLAFDSDQGLSCDAVFKDNLLETRETRRRIVEVTRLAIAPEFARSKVLLVRLFNFIYIYARKVRRADDFVIEVNPRHVNYYRRLLGFEQLGCERPCPRVQGAPACLLKLDLAYSEQEVEAEREKTNELQVEKKRALYPYFYGYEEEQLAIQYLMRNVAL